MDQERITRICFCAERIMAMTANTFRYSFKQGGWYLTDAPTRSMSDKAAFYAFIDRAEYPHPDHRGERTIHRECPWCQNQLPGVPNEEGDEIAGPFGQGDGAE